MEKPARVAAEVFVDLVEFVDPARTSAPSEARILEILGRLMDEDALTFRLDPAGELLVRADQLAIGVTSSLNWLINRVVECTDRSRAMVLADLRKHIAIQ